jgi:hypothetical protein
LPALDQRVPQERQVFRERAITQHVAKGDEQTDDRQDEYRSV